MATSRQTMLEFFQTSMHQLRKLKHEGLLSSAFKVGEFAVGAAASHDVAPTDFVELCVLMGECCFELKQYRMAEAYYRKAHDAWKFARKCHNSAKKARKSSSSEESLCVLPSEHEIKYRIATCLGESGDDDWDAAKILESIPSRSREPKMSLLLANLYLKNGNKNGAINTYVDVLQDHSFCLEAAEGLIECNFKVQDVLEFVLGVREDFDQACPPGMEWIIPYLKTKAAIKEGQYPAALAELEDSEIPNARDPKVFTRTPQALSLMGRAAYLRGDYKKATSVFMKSVRANAKLSNSLELCAAVYAGETVYRRDHEIDALISELRKVSRNRWDTIMCQAYQARMAKQLQWSAALCHQVLVRQPKNEEALILLGTVLTQEGRIKEAVMTLKQAVATAPHRFEAHGRLVAAYTNCSKFKEALNAAVDCCKTMGESARTLTLCAMIMKRDSNIPLYKSRSLLEKAMARDSLYLPAVGTMADLYESRQLYDKSMEILEKAVETIPDTKLHQRLGDVYLQRKGDQGKAMEHYSIALKFLYHPILCPDQVTERYQTKIEKMDPLTSVAVQDHNDSVLDGAPGDSDAASAAESRMLSLIGGLGFAGVGRRF